MSRSLTRLARLASLLAAAALAASCRKPTPVQLTMAEIDRSWTMLQKLYDKPGPNAAAEHAAQIGKLLASSDITNSKAYSTNESFRELAADTIDELGALQTAQATGSMTRIKELCQRCHDQKWPK